ncbi:hypothetical protein, partial [Mesorhizobium sp.]
MSLRRAFPCFDHKR